jgi:hypothetical protein
MSKCKHYDSNNGLCNNPDNPAGIGTKSGVDKNPFGRCNDNPKKCTLNGGNNTGKCSYYDASKGLCYSPNNPAGIGTNSGVVKNPFGKCNDGCQICSFSKIANSSSNTFTCPYCKKQISQIAKKIGRCPSCGSYF